MSGTVIGGKRAAETNKAKYGSDFYANIGRKGGSNGTGGGFAYGDNGKKFGKRGGLLSRRPRIVKPDEPLEKEEMEELMKLSNKAIKILVINGAIGKRDEARAHKVAWEYAGKDQWKEMFTDLGIGPAIEVAWVAVLADELNHYKNAFVTELDTGKKVLTEYERNRFKIINNLRKAFEIASGRRVK